MEMKQITLVLLLLLFSVLLSAQSANIEDVSGPPVKPDWVSCYQRGEIGKISADRNSFFGVGSSNKNQKEADFAARLEFASNVETRVEISYKEIVSVNNGQKDYNLEINTQVRTELSLKGVAITEKWQDPELLTYYSLIIIPRDEYAVILEQNIKEEITLRKTRLAQERARVEAEAEQQRLVALEEQNQLEQESIALEEVRRLEELKQQRRAVQRQKYRQFLDKTPQAQLIGFRNSQLSPTVQRYGFSMGITPGITPFEAAQIIQRISFGYTFFQFLEISGETTLLDSDGSFRWASQELGAKIRLLNGAGELIKMSLAAGGKFIFFDLETLLFESGEVEQMSTFYCSGVLSFPMILYSHLSFYAGADRVAAGITSHPLFFLFSDSIGFIGEVNYLFDDRLRRDAYHNGWLVQCGLRFKTAETLATTLSWVDHGKFVLSVDLCF